MTVARSEPARPVGVLALQGGVAPHVAILTGLGRRAVLVRTAADLHGLDGLVLPGGESTTINKLIDRWALAEPLDRLVQSGVPVLATCAGLIVAAAEVRGPDARGFGWLNVAVRRNAWGRQVHSFEATTDGGVSGLFIRAPRVERVGEGVEVIDALAGEPVVVRQGNVVGATFHPELTSDAALHRRLFG